VPAPIFNGTTLYPSSISRTTRRSGSLAIAANGSRTWTNRGTKQEWTIEWNNVSSSVRSSVITIAHLTIDWTFVDERGISYTVHSEGDPIDIATGHVLQDGDVTYDLTLRIYEV
jgi:hypothetical protein